MKTARGYTLVELLIVISIIAILFTFSLSGYSKAQERQTVQQAKEAILGNLQTVQKAAYVGDKDCNGKLSYIEVTFTASAIQSTSHCLLNSLPTVGTTKTVAVGNVTFNSIPAIMFRPLSEGVSFASGNSANVDYVIGGNTYRITVTPPGIINYVGKL